MFPDVYSIFPHLPNLDIKYVEEARTSNYVRPHTDQTNEFPDIARSTFEDTKFMKDLAAQFGQVRANYLKTNPHSAYHWHIDLRRKVSVNFLLNDVVNNLTLFRGTNDGLYSDIVSVPYELYRPTALDTSIKHTVFNYSNETRYILSVGFSLIVSYAQVCEFLNNYQTTAY